MLKWVKNTDETELPREWIRSIIELTFKYPNVYTDISCLNLYQGYVDLQLVAIGQKPNIITVRDALKKLLQLIWKKKAYNHLKNKLIFGSDWYLTHLTSIAKDAEYGKYCNEFKKLFYEVDDSGEFWERVSLINPWKCYSLSEKKFKNMYEVLPKLAKKAKAEENGEAETNANNEDNDVKKLLERLNELNTNINGYT
jgi:hypothetical protein